MERFTKSKLGAKNLKLVDRPEFGLVLSQLDIDASIIRIHQVVITRKIKDGRRRPCLSTDRNSFWYLHN